MPPLYRQHWFAHREPLKLLLKPVARARNKVCSARPLKQKAASSYSPSYVGVRRAIMLSAFNNFHLFRSINGGLRTPRRRLSTRKKSTKMGWVRQGSSNLCAGSAEPEEAQEEPTSWVVGQINQSLPPLSGSLMVTLTRTLKPMKLWKFDLRAGVELMHVPFLTNVFDAPCERECTNRHPRGIIFPPGQTANLSCS